MSDYLKWGQTPKKPVLGKITQGVAFTCAKSEDYAHCKTWGLTITARCDVSQDKAALYSYLPTVSLHDWWHVDGAKFLIDRSRTNAEGSLKTLLKEAGLSVTVLQTTNPKVVIETHFPENGKGNHRKRGLQHLEVLSRLNGITTFPLPKEDLNSLCASEDKVRESIMKELTSQRLSGHYFIPQVSPNNSDEGFVVLLREVRHLSRAMARQVAIGCTADVVQATEYLNFEHFDFAMPVGVLPSPQIEHLMQQFTSLFSRIGLEDLPTTYINELWPRQKIA